jgi:hypothetical protein
MSVLIEPVAVEDLARLRELAGARDNVAHKLLSLELEKISILAAGRRVDEEHDVLLRRIMTDRSIPLTSTVDINPRTGEIIVESAVPPPVKSVPVAAPG